MPQIHVEEKAKRTLYVSFFIRAKMGCQSSPQRHCVSCERFDGRKAIETIYSWLLCGAGLQKECAYANGWKRG